MKPIEVTIMGQGYVLSASSGEREDALLAAVARVDQEMSAIRDGRRIRARERIAVLAAVNLAYALITAEPAGARQDATGSNADEATIDALMARIDHALGADGQLI
jgi:cell division protein ZapA